MSDHTKYKAKKTVSSILSNSSTRSKNNSANKTKRSLSFKSPSDHEKSSEENQSDHEVYGSISPKIVDCSSKEDLGVEIPTLKIAENDSSRNKHSTWKNFSDNKISSPWQVFASEIDYQNQVKRSLAAIMFYFFCTFFFQKTVIT
ncbi:hypothetical protein ElyMa_002974700 [Elysia marginata]|uniref:Uncharacterized protein n=1 Tax=Elysia marginata TaxID=1093978 RepID=A0AAV4I9W8_9GAST|nr:hypothetical protein ElyMa_002974700 [Elysia marginata]